MSTRRKRSPVESRISRLRDRVVNRSIVVVVWGSGLTEPTNPAFVRKRQKIRDVLQSTFPGSSVHFSEDAALNALIPGAKEMNFLDLQMWHLEVSDVCIVLETTDGPRLEVATYARSRYASKLRVLRPDATIRTSGAFDKHLHEKVVTRDYSQLEFDVCNLVDVAVSWVSTVAFHRLLHERRPQ